jgi:putative membrane protein
VTPHVIPVVLIFGLAATVICGISWLVERTFELRISLAIAPFEFAGAALGLMLVLRTNAGYDRWWEARKL